jgi:phospholipid/cholesterol/gamma-HCH transport system substrate-binding protein
MAASPTRDLVVGFFVLAGLAALGWLSLQVGGLAYKGPGGLHLIAGFNQIGGLKPRAPVVISGVKVGQVSEIQLDQIMRAQVRFEVDGRLKLPVDTTAQIRTAGLLGDSYVALEPGAEETVLKDGDVIDRTEDAISIESLVSKFVTSGDMGEKKKR